VSRVPPLLGRLALCSAALEHCVLGLWPLVPCAGRFRPITGSIALVSVHGFLHPLVLLCLYSLLALGIRTRTRHRTAEHAAAAVFFSASLWITELLIFSLRCVFLCPLLHHLLFLFSLSSLSSTWCILEWWGELSISASVSSIRDMFFAQLSVSAEQNCVSMYGACKRNWVSHVHRFSRLILIIPL